MSNRRELLILRCNYKMIMFLVVIKSISIWGEAKRRKKKDHQVRKYYERKGEVDQPLKMSIKKTKKKV